MTQIAIAMLASNEHKANIEAAIALVTPQYPIGLGRKCCADEPGVTPETPASHWYGNDPLVDAEMAMVWQDAINGTLPPDVELTPEQQEALSTAILFTVTNHDDFTAWAADNLGSKNLRFVPDPEI